MGQAPDTGSTITVQGVLTTEQEIDWLRVEAVDTPDDASCNGFHVRIRLAKNPGDALDLTVYRQGCNPGNVICDGATIVEWMTDFLAGDSGECPCTTNADETDKGVHLFADSAAAFTVGVRHAAGAAGACTPYVLQITNGVY